jgi:membrane protein implicated in regulation of membrane protease activity
MIWATFYMICFVVGLVFSLLSAVGSFGRFQVHGHWHLPHFLRQGAAAGRAGHVHVHGIGAQAGRLAGASRGGTQVSFFNFSSLMAFLAWFGGTGYLLTRYSGLLTEATFALALVGGFLAATAVFLFLVKVLLAHESELDPADFEPAGVLGKVNIGIRSGGTGEIVFSQAGTRHTAGARSEDGQMIPKGTEVIVTRCEKGIAYVRRYDEMAGEGEERGEVRKTDHS